MNILLLNLELLAFSIFWSALAMAWAQRIGTAWKRWICFSLPAALPLVLFATVAILAVRINAYLPESFIFWIFFLLMAQAGATGLILFFGFRSSRQNAAPALHWPLAPLLAGLFMTGLLHLISGQATRAANKAELLQARMETGVKAAALVPANVPAAENAIVDVQAAAALYSKPADSSPDSDRHFQAIEWAHGHPGAGQNAPDPAYVRQFLEQNAPAREAILRGDQKPHFIHQLNYGNLSYDTPIGGLTELKDLLDLLLLDARAAAQAGDRQRAIRNLQAHGRYIALLMDHPMTLEFAYILQFSSTHMQTLAAVLSEIKISRDEARSLQLPPSLQFRESYRKMLVLEEAMGVSCFCATFSLTPADTANLEISFPELTITLYHTYLLNDDLQNYRNLLTIARQPVNRPSAGSPAVTPKIQLRDRPEANSPLTRLILFAADVLFTESENAQAETDLQSIALAAAVYHGEKGAWPNRLEDLAPDYMATLPTDPFTGNNFIVRTHGSQWLLYSVGENRRDENGSLDIDTNPDSGDDIALQLSAPPAAP